MRILSLLLKEPFKGKNPPEMYVFDGGNGYLHADSSMDEIPKDRGPMKVAIYKFDRVIEVSNQRCVRELKEQPK